MLQSSCSMLRAACCVQAGTLIEYGMLRSLDKHGSSLEEVLTREAGLADPPAAVAALELQPGYIREYLELHIEQVRGVAGRVRTRHARGVQAIIACVAERCGGMHAGAPAGPLTCSCLQGARAHARAGAAVGPSLTLLLCLCAAHVVPSPC